MIRHAAAADHQQQRDGEAVDHFHQRPEQAVHSDLEDRRFEVALVQVVELAEFFFLAVKCLHGVHSVNVFGEKSVDPADHLLHPFEIGFEDPFHRKRQRRDHRHCGESDQRQLPVHRQHHAGDADQQRDVFEQVDQHVSVEFVDGVGVVRCAGQQAAAGIAVERGQRHPADVVEHAAAQLVQDALADAADEPGVTHCGQRARRDEQEVQHAHPGRGVQAVLRFTGAQEVVDDYFQYIRLENFCCVDDHRQQQARAERRAVREHQGQQLHQAAAVEFFRLRGFHLAAASFHANRSTPSSAARDCARAMAA